MKVEMKMEKINFDDIILMDELKGIEAKYVTCVSENNSLSSLNYKCLNFNVTYNIYNFGIRIIIQENDDNITIELLAENICKNIDVDDDAMEIILNEAALIVKKVKCKLQEYISLVSKSQENYKPIEVDSMVVDNDEFEKINSEEFKNKISNLYLTLKPEKVEYSNNTNSLFLFTRRGAYLAKVLTELKIASFIRRRSGYEINFLEEESRYTNEFINRFAKEVSNMGIQSMSAADVYLDYSW